jgi:hypothetical protein
MILYLSILTVCALMIAGGVAYAYQASFWVALGYTALAVVLIILVDGLVATVARLLPKKFAKHDKKVFTVSAKEKKFYEDNKYVQFDTLYERHTYEIIAVFQTSGTYGEGFAYHLFDDAKNQEAFDDFVAECKALSLYDIAATAEYGDKLITLSTCDKTALENGRLVVVA